MSKIVNNFCKDATFFEVEVTVCVAKKRKYVANMLDTFS